MLTQKSDFFVLFGAFCDYAVQSMFRKESRLCGTTKISPKEIYFPFHKLAIGYHNGKVILRDYAFYKLVERNC